MLRTFKNTLLYFKNDMMKQMYTQFEAERELNFMPNFLNFLSSNYKSAKEI